MSATKRKTPPNAAELDGESRTAAPRRAARGRDVPGEPAEPAGEGSTRARAAPRRKASAGTPGPARPEAEAEDALSAAMARLAEAVRRNVPPRAPDHAPARDAVGRFTDAARGPQRLDRPATVLDIEAPEPSLSALLKESERRLNESTAKTATALDSVVQWMERAEARLNETARLTTERQDRTTGILGEALTLLTRRLDEIDRKVADGQTPSMDAALQAIERLEARVSELGDVARDGVSGRQIEAVLQGFESRIAEIGEKVAALTPRPLGRGGLDPRDEVTSAVAEIRSRQRELDRTRPPAGTMPGEGRAAAPVAGLHDSLMQAAGRVDRVHRDPGVDALEGEMNHLREAIGQLATRDEIASLEHLMRDLAGQLAKAREPGDILAVSSSVEELEGEVKRLSDLVATGIHGKLAHDLERLVAKIDRIAAANADPATLAGFERQLSDIRSALAEMAGPQRVQNLAGEMSELKAELAGIRDRQVDADDFAALKTAVDDIRDALRTSEARPAGQPGPDLSHHFERIGRKLDALSEQASQGDLAAVSEQIDLLARRVDRQGADDDLGARLEELSRKVDRLGSAPEAAIERLSSRLDTVLAQAGSPPGYERLIQKLDRLDETLRRPPAAPEIKPLEDMVRALADRLDRAGRPEAGQDSLDALERQVATLAKHLERQSGRDPALAALEQTMGDLMGQVATLRDGAVEAAERAARTAVAGTLAERSPAGSHPGDDQAPGTVEALQGTLEQVVARLTSLEGDLARERDPIEAARHARTALPPGAAKTGSDRLEEAVQQVHASKGPTPAPAEADQPLAPRGEEILLEPGTGRPRPGAPKAAPGAAEAAPADLKASFIAAARRAAQAAAAEAAQGRGKGGSAAGEGLKGKVPAGLATRLRSTIDKHRRPLILGLAAVVLAIGALQAASTFMGGVKPQATATARIEPAPKAEVPDPRTTQSIPQKPSSPAATSAAADRSEAARLAARPDAPGPAVKESAVETADAKRPPSDAAAAPIQAAPPAPPVAAAPEASDRIANIATVGEIPTVGIPAGLRQAALVGEPAAVYELAARAAEGRGIARDPKLAAKLFERAAIHGLAPAQYRIGNHYEKGVGVQRDVTLAKTWYLRAAEQGNARAMHNLAVLIAENSGERPDYALAVEWFRRAAEQGVRDSQFNLAVLLARGLGAAQDLGQSYTWFAVAAAQGDADAGKKRDEVGARMSAPAVAAAKAAAERWRPEAPNKGANEVAVPANAWAEQPTAAAPAAAAPPAKKGPGATRA